MFIDALPSSSLARRSTPLFPLSLIIDERISDPDICCFLYRSGRRLFLSFNTPIMRFIPFSFFSTHHLLAWASYLPSWCFVHVRTGFR